jgi:hypothetical protein
VRTAIAQSGKTNMTKTVMNALTQAKPTPSQSPPHAPLKNEHFGEELQHADDQPERSIPYDRQLDPSDRPGRLEHALATVAALGGAMDGCLSPSLA